ncbi:MAG: DUF1232 domain-containing protein [Porticoccus sp.]|jgi:uncharacterized membrane protein YkvA (DUF1232 family)|uniref:YkvA family protein n=1 Tax=Porticoccus hydrocarbonoclasticus TaxID=1073414 RepID=UPI000560783B|nr:YkvA family protein [Porticoccus hydrocarbonoclasticus]MBG58685.1 DUF1232 domain-containing protein [Porticoccus sp.]|tara:strand:- start:10014 stop:10373 length:360 start_codon:yes stop_codon:yes gene_type:complete
MVTETGTAPIKVEKKLRYSGTDFWIKVRHAAKTAGRELIEKCLWLHYAARRPDTPAWAKATVYSALAYFILPTDTIPDFIPGGYVDDLAVIASAVATLAGYIDQQVKDRARQRLAHWFD